MTNNTQQIKALTTYAQYMYETNRGKKKVMVNVDDMDEVHVKNVLKKLIRSCSAPVGEVIAPQPVFSDDDVKAVNNAIEAISLAKEAIGLFPHDLTPAPTIWEATIELLTEVQIDLTNVKKHNQKKHNEIVGNGKGFKKVVT
jgi:hypothetical protein